MPLSKARQAEWMREHRKRLKSVIPNENERLARQMLPIQMSAFAVANKPVIPTVIPTRPEWVANPNQYLLEHLKVCPDYNPIKPEEHFEHCPYINPLMKKTNLIHLMLLTEDTIQQRFTLVGG